MKRHVWPAVTLAVAVVLLVMTGELYFDRTELFIMLGATLALSFFYKPHLLTAVLAYAGVTFLDLLIDHNLMVLSDPEVDGRLPSFSEVVSEAYDDFGWLNVAFPLVLALAALFFHKWFKKEGRV